MLVVKHHFRLPLFVVFVLLLAYTVGQGAAVAEKGEIDWTIDPRHAAWLFIGVAAFTYTYLHLIVEFCHSAFLAGQVEQPVVMVRF